MSGFEFDWLMTEAVEQAGLDPEALTARQIDSITRSLTLLFIELETQGAAAEFRQMTTEIAAQAGAAVVLLPDDTIDVSQVVVSSAGGDCTLGRIHRDKWLSLNNRTSLGLPSSYWLSKSLPQDEIIHRMQAPSGASGWGGNGFGLGAFGGSATTASGSAPVIAPHKKCLVLWPGLAQDATITINRVRQIASPAGLAADIDAQRSWIPTIAVGLASKIAGKYNKPWEVGLVAEYAGKLNGRVQDENMHPVQVGFRAFGWSRERRH